MYGFHMGSLHVYVTSADGSTTSILWQLAGDQGPGWFTTSVNVPPLYPNLQVKCLCTVCVCAHVYVCVCVCLSVCVRALVCACVCVSE